MTPPFPTLRFSVLRIAVTVVAAWMQRRFEIQPDRGAGAGVELTRHVVVEVAIVGASGTAEDDVLLVAEQVVGEAEPRLDRTGIRITVATGADVVVDVVVGEIGRASCRERVCQYV